MERLENIDGAECSVVICTYNPVWEKLRLTLKSILMQENCNFEIVITDDGSQDSLFDKIEDYLKKYSFDNYRLIANQYNQGTVQNILRGVITCKGALVKPVSPGDFLHGRDALRQWVDFMREHAEYSMSYCDAIYYHWEENRIVAGKFRANPQSRMPNAKQYLIYRDLCLGASVMVRRKEWITYLNLICGKVVYAEDFSYQLMLYHDKKIINIPKTFLLYEYGTGVSTCHSKFWIDKLKQDRRAMDEILLSSKIGAEAQKIAVDKYLQIPSDNTLKNKWKRVKFCPSKILFRLKWKFFPRMTKDEFDESFVTELLKRR